MLNIVIGIAVLLDSSNDTKKELQKYYDPQQISFARRVCNASVIPCSWDPGLCNNVEYVVTELEKMQRLTSEAYEEFRPRLKEIEKNLTTETDAHKRESLELLKYYINSRQEAAKIHGQRLSCFKKAIGYKKNYR